MIKKAKQIIAILLAVSMISTLFIGCNNSAGNSEPSASASSTESSKAESSSAGDTVDETPYTFTTITCSDFTANEGYVIKTAFDEWQETHPNWEI